MHTMSDCLKLKWCLCVEIKCNIQLLSCILCYFTLFILLQYSLFLLNYRCVELEQSSNLLETHTDMFGDKHHLYKVNFEI